MSALAALLLLPKKLRLRRDIHFLKLMKGKQATLQTHVEKVRENRTRIRKTGRQQGGSSGCARQREGERERETEGVTKEEVGRSVTAFAEHLGSVCLGLSYAPCMCSAGSSVRKVIDLKKRLGDR